MKFRWFLLLFCFTFAISSPISAQEFWDGEEEEVEEEFLDEEGDVEEYEDYVEEGEEETVSSELNDRVKYFDIAGVMIGQDYEKVREVLKERKYKLTDIEYKIPQSNHSQ